MKLPKCFFFRGQGLALIKLGKENLLAACCTCGSFLHGFLEKREADTPCLKIRKKGYLCVEIPRYEVAQ